MRDNRVVSRRQLLKILAATGATIPIAGGVYRMMQFATPGTVQAAERGAVKHVADVLRFSTRPQGWKGLFGSSRFA